MQARRRSWATGSRPVVILLAVRWYLRFGLSYRDLEELLLSAGSRWTTSASTDGCSMSPRSWLRQPDRAAMPWVAAGSSTKAT
jgi:hypothetical protein